jgi:hypothetical protein
LHANKQELNYYYYYHLCKTAIITRNLRDMRSTCPRVFITLVSALKAVGSSDLLDLIVSYFMVLRIIFVHSGIVKPDNYPPPLVSDIHLPFVSCIQNYEYPYLKFASGDYTKLYNILSVYDWSCVHDTSSVDAAVASLNPTVQDATKQGILPGVIANSKYPCWWLALKPFVGPWPLFHFRNLFFYSR